MPGGGRTRGAGEGVFPAVMLSAEATAEPRLTFGLAFLWSSRARFFTSPTHAFPESVSSALMLSAEATAEPLRQSRNDHVAKERAAAVEIRMRPVLGRDRPPQKLAGRRIEGVVNGHQAGVA